MSFDLKSVLTSIAPTLATMLGGPFAGAAVEALEGAFGLQPGAGTDGITKVIQGGQMTPEIVANVRAADQKHAEVMQQQGIDLVRLNADHEAAMAAVDAADRASARTRETVVRDDTPRQLAWVIIGGFLGVSVLQLIMLTLYPEAAKEIPSQGWLLIGNISGYLASEAKQAAAYYFGSSAGSKDKDATIADIAKAP